MILQRCLAGYSPWGHKESDMTEWLSAHTHTPPTVSLLLLCPWMWDIYIFFFSDVFQHPPVDVCSAARCDFGVLAREDEHMSFYSTTLISSITVPLSIWKPWNFDSTTFKTLPKSFHSIQL